MPTARDDVAPSRSRDAAGDSLALLAGTAVNGLLAFVFFATATRTLGAAAAAPVAVLWTWWGVATAAIGFPVQQWTISTVRTLGEPPVRAALPRLWSVVLGIAALVAAGAWALDDRLFPVAGPLYAVLCGIVTVGATFTGLVRGGLAGRGRYVATAFALASDNVARVASIGLLFLFVSPGLDVDHFAWVLSLGALVGIAWPEAVRFERGDGRTTPAPFTFVGWVAAGSAVGQLLLVGGPVVLRALGGSDAAVSMLFATMSLFRAPYLVAVGLTNRLTGTLAVRVRADRDAGTAFQRVVLGATVVTSPLAAVVGAWLGPAVVELIFGPETAPPRVVAALVAAGSVVGIANLALSVLAIAETAGGRVTRAWATALVAAVAALLVPDEPVLVVAVAFVAGQVVATLSFVVDRWSRRHRPHSHQTTDPMEPPS